MFLKNSEWFFDMNMVLNDQLRTDRWKDSPFDATLSFGIADIFSIKATLRRKILGSKSNEKTI